mmetsp:Transcript_33452/g.92615  ORF Transcript_33452/g.92615 Transcript_33452/m.92615 type:complete len:214 (-) Transcript_33452:482-1123(-)
MCRPLTLRQRPPAASTSRPTSSPVRSRRASQRPSRMRSPAWLPTSRPEDSMIQLRRRSSPKEMRRWVRPALGQSAKCSWGDMEVTPMSRRSPGRSCSMWTAKNRQPPCASERGPFPMRRPPPFSWQGFLAALSFRGVGRSTCSPRWCSQKLHGRKAAFGQSARQALRKGGSTCTRSPWSAKPATRTVRASRRAGSSVNALPQTGPPWKPNPQR